MYRLRVVGALCVVAALMAGCGTSTDAASSGNGAKTDPGRDAASSPGPAELPVGPVRAFLRELEAAGQLSVEEEVESINGGEASVAACMREQGFEYPYEKVTTADIEEERTSNRMTFGSSTREWVAEFGYGLLTRDTGPVGDYRSLSLKYRDTLSAAQKEAYDIALFGSERAEEQEATYKYDWKTAGCAGAAGHEFPGSVEIGKESGAWSELADSLADMESRMYDGAEMQKLTAKWGECMASSGYTSVTTRSAAMFTDSYPVADGAPAEVDPHKREVAQALADWDCAEKVDYEMKEAQIRVAAEEQFMIEHKVEIARLRAELEQGH